MKSHARGALGAQRVYEDSDLSGVVFFDIESNSWYVLARNGSKAAHGSSPIHEKDAFVFFLMRAVVVAGT